MSQRGVIRLLSVVVACGLLLGSFAAVAPAKSLSPKAKAKVRSELRKQVNKNPRVIQRKSFLKKASLVNFKLPITVRLRGSSVASNPNLASIDLGASLGQRRIGLGGKLAGEISFKDSFDGGALGNVDLSLNPGPKSLSTTSIPLLWNTSVSAPGTNWDFPYTGIGATGCGDFTAGTFQAPYFANAGDAAVGSPVAGYVSTVPGIDNPNLLTATAAVGSLNNLGPDTNPFPQSAQSVPYGFAQPPSVKDSVFRTAPLDLQIATAGTEVLQSDASTNGPQGSQNLVVGKSGGQANLFGNIPGKTYGIDVTVNLATRINSVLRSMDPDLIPLINGQNWTATYANCRQAYTGAVQNYITGVKLIGNLRISPGITSDGFLRIAKATLTSQEPARIALAACLSPYSLVASELLSSDTVSVPVPNLPTNDSVARATPNTINCNATPTKLIQDAPTAPLTAAALANGYSTTADGSRVSVSGDLNVNNVSADVLIGDH
ncbi:MAG: hypothetical protein QOH37_2188 [Nocardioidaceae bacterium]|nr:hypothetical protein [Nocardioidaceae bacterium]